MNVLLATDASRCYDAGNMRVCDRLASHHLELAYIIDNWTVTLVQPNGMAGAIQTYVDLAVAVSALRRLALMLVDETAISPEAADDIYTRVQDMLAQYAAGNIPFSGRTSRPD